MGGLGFDSQAVQIGHNVVYGSPFLQRFSSVVRSCVGQAHSRVDEPRHSFTYFDVTRDNNDDFFENLFALPNDAKTCWLRHDVAYS